MFIAIDMLPLNFFFDLLSLLLFHISTILETNKYYCRTSLSTELYYKYTNAFICSFVQSFVTGVLG